MLKRSIEQPTGGKELIRKVIVGNPGERRKEYLDRVSKKTGIGYWTLVQIWQDAQWHYKARAKLTEVIENENNLPSKVQQLVVAVEAAESFARSVDEDPEIRGALSVLLEQVRNIDRKLGSPTSSKALKFALAVAVALSALLFIIPHAEAHYVW